MKDIKILEEKANSIRKSIVKMICEAKSGHPGCLLYTSLDCVVNNIYEVRKDGATLFKGDYNSYIAQRDEVKEVKDRRLGAVGAPDIVRCTPDSPVPLLTVGSCHASRADYTADRWPDRLLAHRTVRC